MDARTCTVCHQTKPLSEFTPRPQLRPGAVYARCKQCKRIYEAEYARNNKQKIAAYHAKRYLEQREEISRQNREWRKKNPEAARAIAQRHWRKNIELSRERKRNKTKQWREANPVQWRAITTKATMLRRSRLARWANLFFIEEIYDLARRRRLTTGIDWHVDHIVPLCGRNVSGLHVENNLRVIPAKANLLKNSRFDERMLHPSLVLG